MYVCMLIAVFAILTAENINDTIMSLLTTELAYALSMLVSAMLLTDCCPWFCGGRFSICTTH